MGALVSALAEGIKPVNFGINTPVQNQAQMATLAGIQQENALKTQQTQQANLTNQVLQRTLNDQDVLKGAFADSNNLDDVYENARKGGASPEALMNLMNHNALYKKTLAESGLDQLKLHSGQMSEFMDALDGSLRTDDPNLAQAGYARAVDYANKNGLVPPGGLPQGYPGKPAVQNIANIYRTHTQEAEDAKNKAEQTLKEQQAAAAKATAAEAEQKTTDARRAAAVLRVQGTNSQEDYDAVRNAYPQETADWPETWSRKNVAAISRTAVPIEKQPEFDTNALKLKLLQDVQTNPASGADAIDTILPPDKFPIANRNRKEQYLRAGQGMTDLNEISKARQAVITQAVDEAKESNPEAIRAAATKAGAEAAAKAGTEISTRVQSAVKTEQALAAQAPPGFTNIIDTPTRVKAIGDESKAAGDYAKAAAEAQALEDYITAARSGNQAAMANIPLGAVRSLVNRVNRQELEAQGGQSYARRIQDYADKGITGKVSEDTLKDFAGLAGIARSKAQEAYGGVADNINALGGNIPRMPPGAKYAHTATGPNGHKIGTNDGKTWYDIQTREKVQ